MNKQLYTLLCGLFSLIDIFSFFLLVDFIYRSWELIFLYVICFLIYIPCPFFWVMPLCCNPTKIIYITVCSIRLCVYFLIFITNVINGYSQTIVVISTPMIFCHCIMLCCLVKEKEEHREDIDSEEDELEEINE